MRRVGVTVARSAFFVGASLVAALVTAAEGWMLACLFNVASVVINVGICWDALDELHPTANETSHEAIS